MKTAVEQILEKYKVTHHVVSNLPLTSKQKFRFSMNPTY